MFGCNQKKGIKWPDLTLLGANAILRMMLTSGTEVPLTGPFDAHIRHRDASNWPLLDPLHQVGQASWGAVMLNTKEKSKL